MYKHGDRKKGQGKDKNGVCTESIITPQPGNVGGRHTYTHVLFIIYVFFFYHTAHFGSKRIGEKKNELGLWTNLSIQLNTMGFLRHFVVMAYVYFVWLFLWSSGLDWLGELDLDGTAVSAGRIRWQCHLARWGTSPWFWGDISQITLTICWLTASSL